MVLIKSIAAISILEQKLSDMRESNLEQSLDILTEKLASKVKQVEQLTRELAEKGASESNAIGNPFFASYL